MGQTSDPYGEFLPAPAPLTKMPDIPEPSSPTTPSTTPSLLSGIGSLIGGITGVGALIMNWWSTNKQLEEQRKARAEAQKAYAEQMAESNRRWGIESARAEKALAQQQKQAMLGYNLAAQKQAADIEMGKEEVAMKKESEQWDKYLGIMGSMTSMMSSPNTRYAAAQQYGGLTNG